MPMNQADFFGIWDDAAGLWSTAGKWNYADFPEMKAVEDYAKLGDYDNAQFALLDYFKQRQTRSAQPYNHDAANAKLAPLLADQIIPVLKETYLDTFYVTKTPAAFSFDLLTHVKAATASDKVISFMLMGRHKGTEPAYIYSSQHDRFSLRLQQCRPVLIVDYTEDCCGRANPIRTFRKTLPREGFAVVMTISESVFIPSIIPCMEQHNAYRLLGKRVA